MMKWEKVSVTAKGDGSKVIEYQSGRYTIFSNKRPIPHANRSGSWMYTDYQLYKDGKHVKTFNSLKDAKDFAEVDNGC